MKTGILKAKAVRNADFSRLAKPIVSWQSGDSST